MVLEPYRTFWKLTSARDGRLLGLEGKLIVMPSSRGDQSEDRTTVLLLGVFFGTSSDLGEDKITVLGVLGTNRADFIVSEAGVLGITSADFGVGEDAILKASKFLVASISAWFPENVFRLYF